MVWEEALLGLPTSARVPEAARTSSDGSTRFADVVGCRVLRFGRASVVGSPTVARVSGCKWEAFPKGIGFTHGRKDAGLEMATCLRSCPVLQRARCCRDLHQVIEIATEGSPPFERVPGYQSR